MWATLEENGDGHGDTSQVSRDAMDDTDNVSSGLGASSSTANDGEREVIL